MKYAATIEYSADKEKVRSMGAAHHNYLLGLLNSGHLFAAGPFNDDLGALWVYDAESLEQAEAMIEADPYHAAGIFVRWQIHPLSYWSAKEHKGR